MEINYSVTVYDADCIKINSISQPLEEKLFGLQTAAKEYAFVKRLQGYYVQVFALDGYDQDGDELWQQIQ